MYGVAMWEGYPEWDLIDGKLQYSGIQPNMKEGYQMRNSKMGLDMYTKPSKKIKLTYNRDIIRIRVDSDAIYNRYLKSSH